MSGALSGFRVLDLSRILAGPWASQMLADLGAEVIKVERPQQGDDTRSWAPPYMPDRESNPTTESAYFHSANRGKQSACIDISTVQGQDLIRQLAIKSDVLIENFKVGGLKKYGLDYGSLKSLNPKLVYCSITGFGQTGPYAHRAGYDYILQGMSGLMSVTGDPKGQPQKVGVAVTDIFSGLYASTAILAAVNQRHTTGKGQHIDVALFDVATAVMANQGMNYLATGTVPERLGNAHPNIVPYAVFDCADGYVIIASGNDGQFKRLCRLLSIAADPAYATNSGRLKHRDVLTDLITAKTKAWTKIDLLSACESAGVPAGPINDMADVFMDPQIVAREMQVDLDGIPTVRLPVLFSDADIRPTKASPMLGQDQNLLD